MSTGLTRNKIYTVRTILGNPLQVDTVSGLEDMYREILNIIGNKGRLNSSYYVDVDRDYSNGLFTSVLRLSLRLDKDTLADLGRITGVMITGDEVRIDVDDPGTAAVILRIDGDADD